MISPVGEISRRLESPEESYSRGLARTICAFATAFVVAVLISCIIRSLRRYFHESQHHPSTASTSSPPGQRRREFVVSIPVIIYGIGPSPSSSCTDDTMSMCAICLGEFEKGERVSVLPRCNHMFHTDCIKQWVPEKSMNCPTCRVPAAGRDGGPARMTGRVAEMMGVDNRSLSALLALNLSSSGVTISSHAGNVL